MPCVLKNASGIGIVKFRIQQPPAELHIFLPGSGEYRGPSYTKLRAARNSYRFRYILGWEELSKSFAIQMSLGMSFTGPLSASCAGRISIGQPGAQAQRRFA